MSKTLHINLLGDFRLAYDEVLITSVDSARMQELLAYLLLHRHAAQSRQYLSFLFWPESSEKQARTNLRQLLHHLHLSLPDAEKFIISSAKTVQWNTEALYILDVAQFEQLLEQAGKTNKATLSEAVYRQAIQCYQGDLLKTCYHNWIVADRERLQMEYRKALGEMIQLLEKKRDYPTAIRYAYQLLQADPLHEPAYRLLMRLYASNNDRAGALQIYQQCIRTLQEELAVEPDPDTQAMYHRLLLHEPSENASTDLSSGLMQQDEWPLVGRHQEWEALQTSWQQTLQEGKHLAVIEGEPGIGKTRIAQDFSHWVSRQGYSIAHTRCYEAAGALSYAPITDLLTTPSIRSHLSKLDTVWLSELARLLPDLLIEFPNLTHPGPLTESWQRRKFFEALSRAFTVDGKPKIMLIDDLQWCDQETLSFLHYFLHFENKAKVQLIGTMRSFEYALNEPLKKLLTELRKDQLVLNLRLQPLDEQETLLLAKEVASRDNDQALSVGLFKETEGNPLFIVESIRNIELESQDENHQLAPDNASFAISQKVNEVIAARFARLSLQAIEIMNLGAVIGRKFSFDVLLHAANRTEADLIAALEELMQHYIIREHPSGDFDFSHDKLREVAYAGMSHTRKRWLHRTVAETIEKLYAKQLTPFNSQLAYHYDRAGILEKAVHYYHEAAKGAQEIFANNEAVTFLKRALALVQELPEGKEADQLECSLQTSLAIILVHLKGYGIEEIYQACDRVRMLSKKSGATPSDRLLRTLAINRVVNADFSSSYDIGLELLTLAEQTDNPLLLVEAHYVLGVTQHWLGNYQEAKIHLAQVLKLYDPQQSQMHIRLYGQDPFVICRIRLAMVLLALGQVEEAEELGSQSLEIGIACSHPFSLGYVQHHLTYLYHLQGKINETRQEAEASIALSAKYEFPFWYTLSKMLLGWSIAQQGDREKAIKLMLESLKMSHEISNLAGQPYFWCLLADVLADQGEFTEAFRFIEKAEIQISSTGEHRLEAEHYRIKGEIILKRNPADKFAARAAFEQAIEIARQQGARYFEQKAQACLDRIS